MASRALLCHRSDCLLDESFGRLTLRHQQVIQVFLRPNFGQSILVLYFPFSVYLSSYMILPFIVVLEIFWSNLSPIVFAFAIGKWSWADLILPGILREFLHTFSETWNVRLEALTKFGMLIDLIGLFFLPFH